MCFYLRNWQVTFLLYTLGVFISEYTAKAFTEPRDYRVVFLIQEAGNLSENGQPVFDEGHAGNRRFPDPMAA